MRPTSSECPVGKGVTFTDCAHTHTHTLGYGHLPISFPFFTSFGITGILGVPRVIGHIKKKKARIQSKYYEGAVFL